MSKERQSGAPHVVDPDVRDLAERIRAAMVRRGWTHENGEPNIAQLARAAGVRRWQTAQAWLLAESAPRTPTLRKIARELGVTFEELAKVQRGAEPTNAAWLAFCATPDGQSMTPVERAFVGGIVPSGGGEPTLLTYSLGLLLDRSANRTDR
jgi:transcriptional regulator with XRE-family HTH domain